MCQRRRGERTFEFHSASVVASKNPQDVAGGPNGAFIESIAGDAESVSKVWKDDEPLSDSADLDGRPR
jgi:hypothetical protein